MTLITGSYHRAIYILMMINDEAEAVATKCWRVNFDDPETKAGFFIYGQTLYLLMFVDH